MSEAKQKIDKQVQAIRWRMDHEQFRLADEIRIIPRWVIGLAIVAFLAFQAIPLTIHFTERKAPPLAALIAMGIAGGFFAGALVMLFAYINRDAKRRGMHATFWTLVAIFIPYLVGVIIYFFVRKPLPFPCPQCGTSVTARFNFCPNCKYELHPACPNCKQEVRAEDRYCPHCGSELTKAS